MARHDLPREYDMLDTDPQQKSKLEKKIKREVFESRGMGDDVNMNGIPMIAVKKEATQLKASNGFHGTAELRKHERSKKNKNNQTKGGRQAEASERSRQVATQAQREEAEANKVAKEMRQVQEILTSDAKIPQKQRAGEKREGEILAKNASERQSANERDAKEEMKVPTAPKALREVKYALERAREACSINDTAIDFAKSAREVAAQAQRDADEAIRVAKTTAQNESDTEANISLTAAVQTHLEAEQATKYARIQQAGEDQFARDKTANQAKRLDIAAQIDKEAKGIDLENQRVENAEQVHREDGNAAKAAKKEAKRKRKAEKLALKASILAAENNIEISAESPKSLPQSNEYSEESIESQEPEVNTAHLQDSKQRKNRKRKERINSLDLDDFIPQVRQPKSANKKFKVSAVSFEDAVLNGSAPKHSVEDRHDLLSWISPAMEESPFGTDKLNNSSDIQENAPDCSEVPEKQFSWLPSSQRESLLNTIRNSKSDLLSSPSIQQRSDISPIPAASYDWTPHPRLFSSGVYKSPAPEPTPSTPTIDRKKSAHTTIVPPVKNSATPMAILPPARDYIVHTTPQAIVLPTTKQAILPPTSSQHNFPAPDFGPSTLSKAIETIRTGIQGISSTSKVLNASPILPPNLSRSPFALRYSGESVILPPTFQPANSAPNAILPPNKNPHSDSIIPSTKFNTLRISEDRCTPKDKTTPTSPAKSKKSSTKRVIPDEHPNENRPESSSNKRQKRVITSAGSPSPMSAGSILPRNRVDPPVVVKRGLDLMLSKQEEWEVTGGRFRGRINLSEANDDDTEIEENIAFSSLYIQNRTRPISIANIKFHIVRLQSGESNDLTSEELAGVKVCSVSRGRVKVNISGRKFSIGEDGMWRVREGEKCKVRNQFSEEAVVHVSEVV